MNNWIAKVSIFLLVVLLLHTVINLILKPGSGTNLKIPETEKSKTETETESEVQEESQQPYDNNFADFESPDDDLLHWFNNEVEEKISSKPHMVGNFSEKDDRQNILEINASNDMKNDFDDDENIKKSKLDSPCASFLGVYKENNFEYAPFSR